MIKIPYGLSDFKTLMENNYFYQDRTHFIEKLEQWSSPYVIFLRPRRFGKSLFVSLLHYYYGLEHRKDFDKLFSKTYIGQTPTENANNYLVLNLEFSRIDTGTQESTYQGFLTNVISGARTFLGAYKAFFSEEDKQTILAQTSPEAIVKTIFSIAKTNEIPHKIYLLIDEYDHFANELLSFNMDRFKSDVSSNGFVRKFYESLKTATQNGVVGRIFITGVSPVTLDALTSGFNITSNLTLNSIFHQMMGFTHTEVQEILHLANTLPQAIPTIMDDLRDWYNGYLFAIDAKERLFNPDMVLYFLLDYSNFQKYPEPMLDVNVISDYRKVRNIFKIGGNESEKFELLEELVNKGSIIFPLTHLYNLESQFSNDDFLSLLFYMGMLTIRSTEVSGWQFAVPNYVIKKLYFEYFTAIALQNTQFERNLRPIRNSIEALVSQASPEPFFTIVEQVLKENHSNRDELSYGEKHLQTLMVGLLFPYESYFIHSEYESRRGYPDIFLEKMPGRPAKYEIVLELKYVKKSKAETLPVVLAEAKAQLKEYMSSERFSRPEVRGFYVVFLGGDVYQWGEEG